MSKHIVLKTTCDICKDTWTSDEAEFKNKATLYPVKCLTEQNEGRAVEPYFEFRYIDVCASCKDKLLKAYPLTSVGAMGFNEYKIKEVEK